MKRKRKEGLSSIVTALILIVLVLVAIGVVWVVVRSIITSGSENVGISQLMINLDIKGAYEQGGNIVSNIRRTGEGELVKIKFILFDGQNTEVITKDSTMAELETKSFSITPTQLVPTEITTLSVAPVFKNTDGKETTGDITDVYNLNVGGTLPDGGEDGCVKDCTGTDGIASTDDDWECGLDPVCQESCGNCILPETCVSETHVCADLGDCDTTVDCTGWVCGKKLNDCGVWIDCPPGCPAGQMCDDAGSCFEITPVATGTVEETWPGTSGMYFGSSDLPIDVSYDEFYIEFPGSTETDCLLISRYVFPVEGYAKSHIAFNFETSVQTGDTYQIWETLEECEA